MFVVWMSRVVCTWRDKGPQGEFGKSLYPAVWYRELGPKREVNVVRWSTAVGRADERMSSSAIITHGDNGDMVS